MREISFKLLLKMTQIYCQSCKSHTDTNNVEEKTSIYRRPYLSGFCNLCSKKKTLFIKKKAGGCVPCKKSGDGFDSQDFLSNLPGLPFAKYPGEKHIPNYSYCGPSTRLDIRLDENNIPKLGEEPINRVDQTCYQHDIAYKHAGNDLSKKHEADRIMLKELNAIKDPTLRERLDRLLIKGAINAKLKLGFGIDLEEEEKEKLASELHKPFRKPATLLKVKVFAKDDIWAADLVDMPTENQGRNGKFKFILTVIDLYTRYAFAIPLHNKTASEVKNAFENIFNNSKRMPKKIWCDNDTEFKNKIFLTFLKEHNIEIYSTFNEGKSVVVERLNRTLKNIMWKKFTIFGNQKWVKMLPDVVNQYNKKIHSSIKLTPEEASNHPEKLTIINTENNYENEYNYKKKKPKFSVGNRVRIYIYQYTFTKGYKIKWSEEIFRVKEVIHSSPITYRIEDENKEEIEGRFYESELQKTEF
jgi:hypothetical protein